MQILNDAGAVLLGYLLGAIPFGLIWVRLIAGKDIRLVASGRTGGTNAARAAGAGAGLLTASMDIAKSAASVWLAQIISPGNHWVHVLAPIAAIMGHNYSVFLLERHNKSGLRFRGGAGGGPAAGGAVGLWWPSALFLLPAALLVFFGIGYASVTTISVAVITTIIFAVRYAMGLAPLADVFYGIVACVLLGWALRPNIRALIEGRERFHGWRPWRKPKPLLPERPEESASAKGVVRSKSGARSRSRKASRKTVAARH